MAKVLDPGDASRVRSVCDPRPPTLRDRLCATPPSRPVGVPPGFTSPPVLSGASAFVCARRSRSNAAAYAGLPSSTHSSFASTCVSPDDVFTPVEDASLEDAAGPTRPSDDASPPSCPDAC